MSRENSKCLTRDPWFAGLDVAEAQNDFAYSDMHTTYLHIDDLQMVIII